MFALNTCHPGFLVKYGGRGGTLSKIILISLIASPLLLIAFLQTTTPATSGPLGILLVFILMYTSLLSLLTYLVFYTVNLVNKLATFFMSKGLGDMSFVRSYYFSSVFALAPVIFIGMESVGRVGLYEVVLIGIFMIVAGVYVAKRTA
jgi:hypothetical protein